MWSVAVMMLLGAELSLQPGAGRPGDAVLVTVRPTEDAPAPPAPTGTIGPWELTFLPAGDGFEALLPLSVDAKAGSYVVSVVFGKGAHKELLTGEFTVLPGNFRKSELTVSKKFTNPSKKEQQWSAADQKAFNEAFDVDFEPWLFDDNFAWPRPNVVTAPFGDRRMFNGQQKSQHYGLDLDGDTGDSIFASNAGEVVMVRECFGSGNTVLIHHGGRLFTAYFHLSKFEVASGTRVARGQLIGRVGKTGRVTGPHLHFGVKLDGKWVNPASLLALDFALGPPAPPLHAETPAPEATPAAEATTHDAGR